jgi:hypothetical protein
MFIKWFTKDCWKYLFAKKSSDYNWFEVLICRLRKHSCGVWWYNPTGYDPDMTCKGCGDDLG